MKTSLASALLFSISIGSYGQGLPAAAPTNGPAAPQVPEYAPVSRDANSCWWEWIENETTPTGEVRPRIHRYQEIATGLNYWDASTKQWRPSSTEIQPSAGGAAALKGQHKVTFAADLATFGAIQLETPDGQQLRTHLLGLSYLDEASGKSVFIAQVTNSIGQLISTNQVWYDNAFTGLKAGVRYTYTLEGFEQEVILEEQPPAPEVYGLSSGTTVLQAITEFLSPPEPEIKTNAAGRAALRTGEDVSLQFGAMRFGPGSAFLMGSDTGGARVSKQWLRQNGRWFLVEQVAIADIAQQLDRLPAAQTTSIKPARGSVLHVVSKKRLFPVAFARNDSGKFKPQMARMSTNDFAGRTPALPRRQANQEIGAPRTPAFVLDYATLNTSQTNMVFAGNTTYYISGNVDLYGTNVFFEGGTVLKYAANTQLRVCAPIVWEAGPYRPVVMMSKDCTTTGETISGATGNPGTNHYATTALYWDNADFPLLGTLALTNLRVANASVALAFSGVGDGGEYGDEVNDLQLLNCGVGISSTNVGFVLHNALFANVQTNFSGNNNSTVYVEQLTSDQALWLNQNIGANLFLTNCLLTAIANTNNCNMSYVASLSSSNGVYQTSVGGRYYLANGSPYHDAGTTNISGDTLIDISNKTTYPPIVYVSHTFSTAVNFGPQAQRDTGPAPDLGYHYDPIDWVIAGCFVDTNMSISAGTAIGWYRVNSGQWGAGIGFDVYNQQTLTFSGTATAPDYLVRCNAVQEQDNTGGYGVGGITCFQGNGSYTNAPTVCAQFLKAICLGPNENASSDDYQGFLIGKFNNCEFYNCGVGTYQTSYNFTNCLFYRANAGTLQGNTGNQIAFQNCTLWGGSIYLEPTNTAALTVKDTSLDGGAIVTTANLGANSSYATYDYNAYTNATDPFPVGGAHDQAGVSFNWQTSWFGNFYLLPTSPLLNLGDVPANTLGLYHFTIRTDQAIDGTTNVTVGYHYVATDSNGNPLDANSDGIPDYIEDANGNGLVDSGEIGWNIDGDLGLKVWITRPKNNSLIP